MATKSLFQRIWNPMTEKVSQNLKDTLCIYDGGNIQGFLVELASGKQEWFLFQIESREYDSKGRIQETVYFVGDEMIPQHFFSKEFYPCNFFSQGAAKNITISSYQIVISPMLPQVLHQQQHQLSLPHPLLSPLQHQEQHLPVLPVPQKSTSHQREQKQQNPHNRRKAEPKQTSSLSLNQPFHGQQRQQVPKKPVRHPSRQGAASHNVRQSHSSLPQSFQPQPSPYSPIHPSQV